MLLPTWFHNPNGKSISSAIFGRPFVKRFTLCYPTVLSPVCLSACPVCDIGVLWPNAGWIKMKLGTEVGLGPGHMVLDGDHPAPTHQKRGTAPFNFPPMSDVAKWLDGLRCHLVLFGLCLLWPNSGMDQDATWYGGRPRPRRHCIRCGPAPPPKGGGTAPPILAHVYCGQTAGWIRMPLHMEVRRRTSSRCVRWGPSSVRLP